MAFLSDIIKQLSKERTIYIVSHERPDGDAIASQTALTTYLNSIGFKSYAIVSENFPDSLNTFLDKGNVCSGENIDENATWIAVDCGNKERIASKFRKFDYLAVIDHHINNCNLAKFNMIKPNVSSTCEILTYLLKEAGYLFDNKIINEALYVGMLTDSGNFTHYDVTNETFACAEILVRNGVSPAKLIQRLFHNKSVNQLKLYALFLNRIELYSDNKIVVSKLTDDDYKKLNVTRNDTEGFVNKLLEIKGVKIAIFIENNSNFYKVSLRSCSQTISVNSVAKLYGGGGHLCASGFNYPHETFSFKNLLHDVDSLIS